MPDATHLDAQRFDWYVPACNAWASELAETIESWAGMLAHVRSELAAGVPVDQVLDPEAATRLVAP